tara:strand:+ start:8467 stop:9066 length:600 start_codon:yes stop_codon:yes gene_type:complete
MKNLKTFNEHSNQEDNIISEGIINKILHTILTPISLLITNLLNPRFILKNLEDNSLNYYNNIDGLLAILDKIKDGDDLTDVELSKIDKNIKRLVKVKEKYPTYEDYKNNIKKRMYLINFRNKEFLKRRIEEFEPTEWTIEELSDRIKKFYKNVDVHKYNDDDGDGGRRRHMSEFQKRLIDQSRSVNAPIYNSDRSIDID